MKRFQKSRELLGTWIELTFIIPEESKGNISDLLAEELAERVFSELERIDHAFSRFRENNQLAQLNSKTGEWQNVSDELFSLLKFGKQVSEQSGGTYDMRSKSLLEKWGYDADYSLVEKVGNEDELTLTKEALRNEVFCGMKIDERRVQLSSPVELGGHGKGYAIDRARELLKDLDHFCINAGGDLYVKGQDFQDGEARAWKIAFEHPLDTSMAIGFVEVGGAENGAGLALASSSGNRRQWGKGRHHLVDVSAGEAACEMLAVYTQAESAMVADAFSTALFVMGFEKAREFLETGSEKEGAENDSSLEALLIGPKGESYRSEGFCGELF
jgi:thiamine biosynthesis lipoprotein